MAECSFTSIPVGVLCLCWIHVGGNMSIGLCGGSSFSPCQRSGIWMSDKTHSKTLKSLLSVSPLFFSSLISPSLSLSFFLPPPYLVLTINRGSSQPKKRVHRSGRTPTRAVPSSCWRDPWAPRGALSEEPQSASSARVWSTPHQVGACACLKCWAIFAWCNMLYHMHVLFAFWAGRSPLFEKAAVEYSNELIGTFFQSWMGIVGWHRTNNPQSYVSLVVGPISRAVAFELEAKRLPQDLWGVQQSSIKKRAHKIDRIAKKMMKGWFLDY